jgi:DNA-binding beta-propeller fold protein YncE
MERVILSLIVIGLLALSCERNPYFGPVYDTPTDSLVLDSLSNYLLVGCEGNFQLGNASISRIDLSGETVSNDAFKSANGDDLGDVLQSIYQSGDSLYLILNNSGLIRIVDPITLKQIDVIEGLNSPRYIMVNGKQAYITSLFSDKISKVNLENLQVESNIHGGDWTEHIIDMDDFVAVAEVNSNNLIIYDPTFDNQTELFLDISPRIMEEPIPMGGLIVAGNTQATNGLGVLYVYSDDLTLFDTVHMDPIIDIAHFDSLIYSLHSNRIEVRKMGSSKVLLTETTPTVNNYSISISPDGSTLWVSDVKDYISKGEVFTYDLDQNVWGKTYMVGQIPQTMHFTL